MTGKPARIAAWTCAGGCVLALETAAVTAMLAAEQSSAVLGWIAGVALALSVVLLWLAHYWTNRGWW